MSRNFWQAVAILTGTIIGAGVLGIPYVVAQAGFLTGSLAIILLGVALVFLHLYLGEISLRTRGIHQLAGYAEIYLGKWGKGFSFFAVAVGIYGALIAYIIGVGASFNAIFGVSPLLCSLLFFVIMAVVVFIGLRIIKSWELWLNLAMLIIICAIIGFSIPKINLINLAGFSFMKLLVPYGVILFAFLGTVAIPELKEVLSKDRKRLKGAIILGSMIPLVLYFLFTLVVVGVGNVEEVATIGLGHMIGGFMVVLGNFFAVFAMVTSFLALALALVWIFQYDYHMKHWASWALTCFVPLGIALSGMTGFIQVIGITGAVAGGVEGILIVLMFHRAKKLGKRKPEYALKVSWLLSALLVALFVGGIVYTFFTF